MDKPDGMKRLKQYLSEMGQLREARWADNGHAVWRNRVNVVIEATFGKNSDEYQKWNPPRVIFEGLSEQQEQKQYLADLDREELRLTEIIDKHEILGTGDVSGSGEEPGAQIDNRLFSEREGPIQPAQVQAPDYLPKWVREAIPQAVGDLVAHTGVTRGTSRLNVYPIFKPHIWKVLGTHPPTNPSGGPFHYYIPAVFERCSWNECYDILEEICQRARQVERGEEHVAEFTSNISAILAGAGIPWKMEQGKVVRRFGTMETRQIAKVTTLLSDPRFRGPDEQFAKALDHLNRRPTPDEENCVKDAVGALEGVANIIAGTTQKQLNVLLGAEPFRSGLNAIVTQAIEKLYAFRGALPGAAHSQVGPAVADLADATWTLSIAAATIIYLVSKFP